MTTASTDKKGEAVVLRSPNWLGDAVIAMPAVQQLLLRKRPDTTLSILTPPKLFALWKLLPGVHELLPATRCVLETSEIVRSKKFDAALIFPNSLRTGLEMCIARVPERLGYEGHFRKWLLTHSFKKTKPINGVEHQKFDYLRLLRLTGLDVDMDAPLPDIVKPEPLPSPGDYIAVCPGAEYGPAKRWPAERFAAVANELGEAYGLSVVLLGAKVDAEQAAEVEKQLTVPFCNCVGETSLEDFIRYLAHARVVVCNDSGAMHLASLLRTPCVAVFGSTEPKLTGPLSNSTIVLREHVPCSPCFLRECPIDFRCMQGITVDQAVQAAKLLLDQSR